MAAPGASGPCHTSPGISRTVGRMAPELLGRHDGLVHKRERMRKRISDLRLVIEAERSILSALKMEAEGAGFGRRG